MRNEKVAPDGQIEARIDLVFDLHLVIQEALVKTGLSRSELAVRMGITKARLSQLMRPEANPTAYTLADIFHACGQELAVSLKSGASHAEEIEEVAAETTADKVLFALFRRPAAQPVVFAGNENVPDDWSSAIAA